MATVHELLSVLTRLRIAPAGTLARELGVSQPTVSRLLGTAGPRVCRMGRGRATRYAATREVAGLGTHLPVYCISETGRAQRIRELHLLVGGGHWLASADGSGDAFEGLPPFAVDMSPQGYIGRAFSAHHLELDLPIRLSDWSDDHRLQALARRGEDCVGNLVIGEESLNRWLSGTPLHVEPEGYPELARDIARQQAGSSAGGEHPKFLVFSSGRHVLVKFASSEGATDRRWQDLLVCESLALAQVRAAGIDASTSRWLDVGRYRFLEVERFDRIGERGRRGVVSLAAFDSEYIGSGGPWTRAATRLRELGHIEDPDARRIRWLDAFGALVGNTDRHLGNLAFFSEVGSRKLRLAPVDDMLPMVFAPSSAWVVEREFSPRPPTAEVLDVWQDAAHHACGYWREVGACSDLSEELRSRAMQCLATLERLRERVLL